LLAAPLTVLGIYCILPHPSYDCDCAFAVLVAVWFLQRLEDRPDGGLLRGIAAGTACCIPLFFKQNIGMPFLAAVIAVVVVVFVAGLMRSGRPDAASPVYPSQDEYCSTPPLPQRAWQGWGTQFAVSRMGGIDGASTLLAVLGGAAGTLLAAAALLHFTVGVGNYVYWTIGFAAQRRLPGLHDMMGVYLDPALLWTLPCVIAALLLLRSSLAKARWARIVALILLAAPFLFVLCALFLYDDADERGDSLLALWPLLLILSAAVVLFNLFRHWRGLSLRVLLPVVLLATINGTLLSQQLWGSTYAIWPQLILLIAELIAFLSARSGAEAQVPFDGFMRGLKPPPPSGESLSAGAKAPVYFRLFSARLKSCPDTKPWFISDRESSSAANETHADFLPFAARLKSRADTKPSNALGGTSFFAAGSRLALVMAGVVSATLLICGGFYTASEERLSYVQLPEEAARHSALPQLAGMAVPGPYLPDVEELLAFAAANIPASDGLILLPGEDPFYFVTGRVPQFPVLLFDPAADPYSPAEVVEQARLHQIRWLVVKRELQIKEDPTPQREATLTALLGDFTLSAQLRGYDIYLRR